MTKVQRTFTVSAPPERVIPYLADFANAEQWDPGTVRCVRQGDGPVAVGARWDNTSKIAGMSTDLEYTLEGLDDRQVVLVGRNKTATSTETIDVRPSGAGSEITYVNDTVFHGAAKLAAPLVRLIFEGVLAKETVKGITENVNRL